MTDRRSWRVVASINSGDLYWSGARQVPVFEVRAVDAVEAAAKAYDVVTTALDSAPTVSLTLHDPITDNIYYKQVTEKGMTHDNPTDAR